MRLPLSCLLVFSSALALAQESATIRVDAAQTTGPFPPIYGYFGYDEPNYTYTKNGKKLISELAVIASTPV